VIIGNAIFAKLSESDQVKTIAGDRIYPIVSSDDKYPLIVYEVSRQTNEMLDRPDLINYTVSITVVSQKYATTCTLANAVIDALDRKSGTWGGIEIRKCNMTESTSEDAYSEGSNIESIFYTQDQTYSVWAYKRKES